MSFATFVLLLNEFVVVVVYFIIDSVQKFLDTPSYNKNSLKCNMKGPQ
jgi:hypothetical protein